MILRYFHKPGSLISSWTPALIAHEIKATGAMIRNAFNLPFEQRAERLEVLLSRQLGLRICAGQVDVKLKPHP